MIGDLYKKIVPLLLVINVCILCNTLDDQNYIFPDFIPYQESKTSIGINIYNNLDKIQESFLLNNWFTNNLYVNGSISSLKTFNEIALRYNASIGYAYNMDYKLAKNMIFMLGYNRSRFENNESDNINMSYNLLFNMKLKSFWISLSYGIINDDSQIQNFSINFVSSIFDSFILTFGVKNIFNNQDNLITPSLSLRYKI